MSFQPGNTLGKRWQKGESGNPKGRSKLDFSLAEAARAHSPEMLQIAVAIARDARVPPESRLRAVEIVLSRGHGKPIAAHRVDEVAGIRDKAMACEYYAKLAKNPQNERLACEIRLRAERKAGHLLRETKKAKAPPGPGRGNKTKSHDTTAFSGTPTLADLKISKSQSSRWQQLADVPEATFEAALAAEQKPSTSGIIRDTFRCCRRRCPGRAAVGTPPRAWRRPHTPSPAMALISKENCLATRQQ